MPEHAEARRWWEEVLNGDELIGLPYEIPFGFRRRATNPRLGSAAVTLKAARAVVELWLGLQQVRTLTPSAKHFGLTLDLMAAAGARGAVLSDAILAGYAIENRARLYTNDPDFARFPGLVWENPLNKVCGRFAVETFWLMGFWAVSAHPSRVLFCLAVTEGKEIVGGTPTMTRGTRVLPHGAVE
jgi:toxin-antitoxin system PIN domain toxin